MSDLDDLADALLNATGKIVPLVQSATEKSLADIVRVAQNLVPVDTGYLKSSIGSDPVTVDKKGTVSGVAGPTADYAEYVEDGTSRMGPQPYMGPAAERVAPLWVEAVEQLMDRIL